MLEVNIEKIVPVTEARDMFNKIVDEVEGTDDLYVLTKNGKPAAVVVGVNHLEKLTGQPHGDVVTQIEESAASEESPALATPDEEETETVFASADDVPQAAPVSTTPETPDPFELAKTQLTTEQSGTVAAPESQLATQEDLPTTPSTENSGQVVSRINPVPAGFAASLDSPNPAPAPSQARPEDEDSAVAPDDNMSTPTLAEDPLTPPIEEEEDAEPTQMPPAQQ